MADTSHDEPLIRRRWWLALLLLFASGAGYLYVGRPGRFLAYLIVTLLTWLILSQAPSDLLSYPQIYLGLLGCVLAIAFAMAIDVVHLAIKQREIRANWYNRWWIYLGFAIATMGVTSVFEFTGSNTAMAVRTFSIPSISNLPTLQIGDYFVADNRAYERNDPARGDVVVFRLARDESVDYVKRVIGLPGDKIQITDGIVSINGVPVDRKRIKDFVQPDGQSVQQYLETLPNGRSFLTLDLVANSPGDNMAETEVPPDHYFVLGDNRDNSADSRFPTVGTVPRGNIFARAGGIYYSTDFKRIGTRIE